MQKSCRYFLVCVIAAGLFACVREPHEASSGSSPQRSSRLSVDEARAFFEKNLSSDVTRASDAVPTGPFVVENVLPSRLICVISFPTRFMRRSMTAI